MYDIIYLTKVAYTRTIGCAPRGISTSVTLGIPNGSTGQCPLALRRLSGDGFRCR